MNSYLRSDSDIEEEPDEELLNKIDIIQQNLLRNRLSSPMSFIRGQATWEGYSWSQDKNGNWGLRKPFGSEEDEEINLDSLIGKKWTSDGFLSSSTPLRDGKPTKSNWDNYGIQVHILAPAGASGMPVNDAENEFLFPYGTQFEIVNTEVKDDKAHLYVKVNVPSAPKTQSTPVEELEKLSDSVTTPDSSKFDSLIKNKSDFVSTMESLKDSSYFPIEDEDIEGAFVRASFRNPIVPNDEETKKSFEALQAAATEYIKNNPISILVSPEALDNIVREGRFQTMFHDPEEKGDFYYGQRSIYEKAAFGYDESNTDPDSRPVYGAVWTSGQKISMNTLGLYGNIQIVLKDSAKDRTTYSLGDSLDGWHRPTKAGEDFPRNLDNYSTSYNVSSYNSRNTDGSNYFEDRNWQQFNYLEAQVHGGVTISDVEKVIFNNGEENNKLYGALSITQILDEAGIPWEVQR